MPHSKDTNKKLYELENINVAKTCDQCGNSDDDEDYPFMEVTFLGRQNTFLGWQDTGNLNSTGTENLNSVGCGKKYCSTCWDENVCHRCFNSEEFINYNTCERCNRRIRNCCVAICYCQCLDVICIDCIKPEDNTCDECNAVLITPPVYPYVADDKPILCAAC